MVDKQERCIEKFLIGNLRKAVEYKSEELTCLQAAKVRPFGCASNVMQRVYHLYLREMLLLPVVTAMSTQQ